MRVLAIDTALEVCAAAVLDTEQGPVANESLPMVRGHAEALMPLISRVMRKADLPFSALDRIAVTTGPGSFTGLRVGISAARGIALAAAKPAIGLTTLAAYAAPYIAHDDKTAVAVAIDARHQHVYLQIFGPGGRTLVAPRIASVAEAARAAAIGPVRIIGTGATMLAAAWPSRELQPALVDDRRAPDIIWVGRLAAAADEGTSEPKPLYLRAPDAQPQERRETAAPMIGMLARLFTRGEPALSEASPRDFAAFATLHAASFRQGWSDGEFERMLGERNIVAHRATMGRTLHGFILSRIAGGEAEILSVAVASARRGRGLARALLNLHLRRLAGIGASAVFLEVDEGNEPARRLYQRAGFREVGRRPGYYQQGRDQAATALVLRRDLV